MNTNIPTITKCTIRSFPRPMPEGMFDPMPEVYVKFSDATEKILFSFFPDEISFNESEFIGLTEDAALRLKFDKDKKYLQS